MINKKSFLSGIKIDLRSRKGDLSLTGFRRVGFLIGIVILFLAIFLPGFSKIRELKQKNRNLSQKIIDLKEENLLLEEGKNRLETDASYAERVARQKLGVTKKGETIYRISPEE